MKIDGTQPTCNRCRNARIECAGYIQSVRFVDERARVIATQERVRTQESQWENASFYGTTTRSAPSAGNYLANPNPTRCQEIGFSAFQDDVCVSFFVHRLLPKLGRTQVIGHWMDVITSHESVSVLSLSLQCVATSFFGRIHQQPAIMARGAQQYGSALRSLSQFLQSPQNQASLAALASINALELYEVRTFTYDYPKKKNDP